MSPGAEITRLGATDLGVEVPSRAQKKILRGWYLDAIIHGVEVDAKICGADLAHTIARPVLQCCAAFSPAQCFDEQS